MHDEYIDWYNQIKRYYGDKSTKRFDVPLINHIDEGLTILNIIGASKYAKAAYCIHPMTQGDESLSEWFYGENWLENMYECDHNGQVIALALEYRSVANECLSDRDIVSAEQIRLSPLKEVNDMLIADKIQNRKDFETYHKYTHDRSNELDRYFKMWLERLSITEERYQEICFIINSDK